MYGIEDKLLSITYSVIMLVIAICVKKATGTFLIPAGIFALTWFAFTFIPLVFLIDVPINSLAILYILTAVVLYSLSAVFFNWRSAFISNGTKSLSLAMFDSKFLEKIIYFSAVAAIFLSSVTILLNGFTSEEIFTDLIKTSGKYAAVRGNDGMEYGVIGIIGTLFIYLCPVLGGIRFFAPRNLWFFVVTITPSLFTMVTQSTKLVFLVSLCFYLTGVLIAKIYANQMRLMENSTLIKIVLGIVILSPLVLVSFISRLNEFDIGNATAIIDPLLYSIASYGLGQIYAFADFFSFSVGFPSASTFKDDYSSFGAFTFASIFNTFGVGKEFPAGMYEESGWYQDVFETNIFTFFRGLIYDFGIFGSLIFMLVFGILSHAVMWRILYKKYANFALALFVAIHVFIFMGYLFSVFVARYVFLVSLVIWLLLVFNAYIYSNKINVNSISD